MISNSSHVLRYRLIPQDVDQHLAGWGARVSLMCRRSEYHWQTGWLSFIFLVRNFLSLTLMSLIFLSFTFLNLPFFPFPFLTYSTFIHPFFLLSSISTYNRVCYPVFLHKTESGEGNDLLNLSVEEDISRRKWLGTLRLFFSFFFFVLFPGRGLILHLVCVWLNMCLSSRALVCRS